MTLYRLIMLLINGVFVVNLKRQLKTLIRTFLTPVLLICVSVTPLGATGVGPLGGPVATPDSRNPGAGENVASTVTTAGLEATNACCAAACIGGGKCGIYCEEISSEDPCESKYRFVCPATEALICQGGSCICAQ